MPYIGKSPLHGNYSKLDDFSGDFDGSDATHALATNGIDVTRLYDDSLSQLRARYIGFVFQNYNLLARESALANVALPLNYSSGHPRSERKKLALAALEKVGLEHRSKHKPSEMSGGEQQRVGIARALVKNPKVLLQENYHHL